MAFFKCGGSQYPDQIAVSQSSNWKLSDMLTNAETIPQYMFYGNSDLISIDAAGVRTIRQYAFYGCDNVNSIDMPDLEYIYNRSFSCRRGSVKREIVNINLPKLFSIESYGFYEYAAQNANAEVTFQRLHTVKSYAFGAGSDTYRWQLKKMTFEQIGGVDFDTYAFQRAVIDTIDIKATDFISTFGNKLFSNASITNLIIRSLEMSEMTSGGDLGNAPTNIYVPDALVATYKANANWNQYSDNIKPLSNIEPPEEEQEGN